MRNEHTHHAHYTRSHTRKNRRMSVANTCQPLSRTALSRTPHTASRSRQDAHRRAIDTRVQRDLLPPHVGRHREAAMSRHAAGERARVILFHIHSGPQLAERTQVECACTSPPVPLKTLACQGAAPKPCSVRSPCTPVRSSAVFWATRVLHKLRVRPSCTWSISVRCVDPCMTRPLLHSPSAHPAHALPMPRASCPCPQPSLWKVHCFKKKRHSIGANRMVWGKGGAGSKG